MSLFNSIFQQILGETEKEIENEKKNKTKDFLKQTEENVEFSFTDYSINLKPELANLEEEEEDDDDGNYRDKDRERELEAKLKKLAEKIKNDKKDSKKNDDATKSSKSDSENDEYNKTSERNPDREMKKIDMEYRAKLIAEADEINRVKRIKRSKEKRKKVAEIMAMKSLATFSLAVLRKKMMIRKIRKMFGGLLSRRQINAIANGRNINLRKLEVLQKRLLAIKKRIIRQIKLQRGKGFFQVRQENYALEKEQKKLQKRTLIISK